MNYLPIVIIGAPRSGTNMLRDILTSFNGVSTWPCDEINYIWRHYNVTYSSDEFPKEFASLRAKKYINKQFNLIAKKYNASFVIEKTCANSLRVPFVEQIIPDARYIFIIRDGMDTVGSASIRWHSKLDILYILRKIRYVPILDLPYYGLRYISNRLYKLFSKENRLSFWGPKFKGFDEAVKVHNLEEVCALQWQHCVTLSEEFFKSIPDNRVIRVRYEDFVSNPDTELSRIVSKLGIPYTTGQIHDVVKTVSSGSVGKGRNNLNKTELKKTSSLISNTLRMYGYKH
jgi:hypothetical protein